MARSYCIEALPPIGRFAAGEVSAYSSSSAGAADTVYAGTQSGPYRSDDGGATWNEYDLPEGVQGVYALACA